MYCIFYFLATIFNVIEIGIVNAFKIRKKPDYITHIFRVRILIISKEFHIEIFYVISAGKFCIVSYAIIFNAT